MQESYHFGLDTEGLHIPTGNSEILLTRRQMLIGAGVVGAAVAVGAGASALQNAQEESASFDTLTVGTGQVVTLDDCSESDADDRATLRGSYELPYGTLMWANSDSLAACLLPTQKADPLVKIALLSLSSGTTSTVVAKAVGRSEGYQIFDARCSDDGLIWIECNILENTWRIYAAEIESDLSIGEAVLVDEGNEHWETPSIVADGKRAYWQVMPVDSDTDDGRERKTRVKTARFADLENPNVIYTSDDRMCTPLAVGDGGVVITPLHEETSSYRNLTLIDSDGAVLDSLTLPSLMEPQDVGYGPTGFTFTFPDIYSYGDGIAELGTYAPVEMPENGDYSAVDWFRFGRAPTQAAAWCGDRLMVKSTAAVCGIEPTGKDYFTFELENGCEDYGDCLASLGTHDTVVTYMNVDNTEAQETGAASSSDDATYCLVRVWEMV